MMTQNTHGHSMITSDTRKSRRIAGRSMSIGLIWREVRVRIRRTGGMAHNRGTGGRRSAMGAVHSAQRRNFEWS